MNKKIRFLIAFGPTREPLDPVRYISNYSTGVMGRHLVNAAKKIGHEVQSIECPAQAETAVELEAVLKKRLGKNDVLIMAAAVCDVRPFKISKTKIKKDSLLSIPLKKNPDILANLSKIKKPGQIFIGFGLESKDILKNGFKKMSSKKLELIVIQQVMKNNKPFGEKPIEAYILRKNGEIKKLASIKKKKLAEILIKEAEKLFFKRL